jgi:hypothetical protein
MLRLVWLLRLLPQLLRRLPLLLLLLLLLCCRRRGPHRWAGPSDDAAQRCLRLEAAAAQANRVLRICHLHDLVLRACCRPRGRACSGTTRIRRRQMVTRRLVATDSALLAHWHLHVIDEPAAAW